MRHMDVAHIAGYRAENSRAAKLQSTVAEFSGPSGSYLCLVCGSFTVLEHLPLLCFYPTVVIYQHKRLSCVTLGLLLLSSRVFIDPAYQWHSC